MFIFQYFKSFNSTTTSTFVVKVALELSFNLFFIISLKLISFILSHFSRSDITTVLHPTNYALFVHQPLPLCGVIFWVQKVAKHENHGISWSEIKAMRQSKQMLTKSNSSYGKS
jgi:hypothetical protein